WIMGVSKKTFSSQPFGPAFSLHQVTHRLVGACERTVDYFVPKTIHKHSTVIRSGFSTGFDNPRRRAAPPRAIRECARRHATRWCDRGRQKRRRFPEDCAWSIPSRAP